jgi:hypothetical protein
LSFSLASAGLRSGSADQLAAFFQLALAGQDGSAPGLRHRQVGGVLDLGQPAFRRRVILAFFRQLRERQIGLGQAAVALTFGSLLLRQG